MTQSSEGITFAQLVALAEGKLAPDERAALLARVRESREHVATLAWIERALGLMRADSAEDAPPEVIARAARLIRPILAPRQPALRERIAAALRFDSRQQPAMGIRSGFSATRQLIFGAGAHEVDLRVAPSPQGWMITGQLLGPEEAGTITLEGANERLSSPLNDLAEFSLPPVAPGAYTLTLNLESAEIAIGDLNVGV